MSYHVMLSSCCRISQDGGQLYQCMEERVDGETYFRNSFQSTLKNNKEKFTAILVTRDFYFSKRCEYFVLENKPSSIPFFFCPRRDDIHDDIAA